MVTLVGFSHGKPMHVNMGAPKGVGRRSGITNRSFSCALECKLQTVACLTLVGTEGGGC
jgi:hypothetical protein